MLIPYATLCRRYQVAPAGILHLGAHRAEEAEDYARAGVTRVLWVEAVPDLIPELRRRVEPLGHRVAQGVVSDVTGREVEFKVTNNGQSSSYLDLGTHARRYPEVAVERTLSLRTVTVEDLLRAHQVAPDQYDFVNLDLQGAELDALRGMGPVLAHVRYIYAEVNREPLYRGCPLLGDLDRFLGARGFRRRALAMSRRGWGDAFYDRSAPPFWRRAFARMSGRPGG